MEVYALIGKSGTGKSFQAMNLCKQYNIESIIDDGLFIYKSTVVEGVSAKRAETKIGAVKTALFSKYLYLRDALIIILLGLFVHATQTV